MVGCRYRLLGFGFAMILALFAWCCAFGGNASAAYAAPQDAALQAGESQIADDASSRVAVQETDAQRVARLAVVKDGLYHLTSVAKPAYGIGVHAESTKANARVGVYADSEVSWAQKWVLVQDKKTGYYTVRNLGSRMLLTVVTKASEDAKLKQTKQAKTPRQLWRPYVKGQKIQLRSAAAPELALRVVRTQANKLELRLGAAKGSPRTTWFWFSKTVALQNGMSYFIRSNAYSSANLAVKDASRVAGAKIVLGKRANVKSQKFRLVRAGKSYRIQSCQSCKYLKAFTRSIVQADLGAGDAELWRFALDLHTGAFAIKSAKTGRFVDATGKELAQRPEADAKKHLFILTPTYGFTVFLDAGHGKNASGWGVYDSGAEGNGREEADLTRDLTARIAAALEGTDIRVFNGSDYSVPYWQRNAKARSLDCDLVLSIHFDADGSGTTTSTMIGPNGAAGSRAFNAIIHPKLVASTGLRDGGTMHRSDITVVNGSVPSVLAEVCFIDNYSSLRKYLNRRDIVAASLAEGVVEASRSADIPR